MLESWKYVREDKAEQYRMMLSIAPVSRTPQDKKSGKGLYDYQKKVEKAIDSLVPWQDKVGNLRRSLRGKVKPGEVLVIFDANDDPNNPLFQGAKTSRE